MPTMKKTTSNEAGFSLLECLIAMVITVIGVLAVEMLIVTAIGTQTFSSNVSIANSLARAKVEELQARSVNDPARANGGSLTDSLDNYSDIPSANYVRRWTLADGANGTQDVQVQVSPSDSSTLFATVRISTLIQ